jgi:DNA modification methylase
MKEYTTEEENIMDISLAEPQLGLWERENFLSKKLNKDNPNEPNLIPIELHKTSVNSTDLNELNGSEWTLHSKSVQTWDSPITEKRKKHGAAFPIALAKHFVKIYSKTGDKIFDPFAGVGTTLDAANILQRHSYGTELNSEFVKLFASGIDSKDGIAKPEYERIVFNDSVENLTKYIKPNSIDMILTNPPYANLLNIM